MLLSDLIAGVATAGEQACRHARLVYVESIVALAGAELRLPGNPSALTVAPLDTVMPKSMKLKTCVELTCGDGGIEAAFVASRGGGAVAVGTWQHVGDRVGGGDRA